MEPDAPSGYGRIVRDRNGDVERVVETKADGDASDAERAIREVNVGIYVFDGGSLRTALAELEPANAQGELYLPDVIPALIAGGKRVISHPIADPASMLQVNNRVELARVTAVPPGRIPDGHHATGGT